MSSGEEKGDKRRGKERTGEEKRETIGEEREERKVASACIAPLDDHCGSWVKVIKAGQSPAPR